MLRRYLVIGLTVLLLAGGMWGLWRSGHQRQIAPARPIPLGPKDLAAIDGIEMHLNKVLIHGLSNGKVVWEVEADNFERAKDRPLLRMTGLRRVAIVNEGKQELTLSAQTLERNLTTGDLSLLGNVALLGDGVTMRTPQVNWDAINEVLRFPRQLAAQVGDFAINTPGSISYDVKTSTFRCEGRIDITTGGNRFHAGSAVLEVPTQRLVLTGPVSIDVSVRDLEDWSAGANLPALPAIPPGIEQRYREYCRTHTANQPFTPRR